MKVLSKAERENQYRKRADAATRKATSPNTDKRQATLRKIKERLQQLNYVINDEKALEEIIGDDNKLNLDKIGILSERGIISLNEKELEAETPQIEFSFDKHNPTFENAYTDSFASGQPLLSQTEELRPAPKIKIFSISEELPELPQSRERQTPASRTAETNESACPSRAKKQNGPKGRHAAGPGKRNRSRKERKTRSFRSLRRTLMD